MTPEQEMALPTVIIDMPEFYAGQRRRKLVRVVWVVFSSVIFLLLLVLLAAQFFFGGARHLIAEDVILTVRIEPADTRAVVTVDGVRLSGNPPYLILPPSDAYHTVTVEVAGFDPVTRDVVIDSSELMTVVLKPVASPVARRAEAVPPPTDAEVSPAATPVEILPAPVAIPPSPAATRPIMRKSAMPAPVEPTTDNPY